MTYPPGNMQYTSIYISPILSTQKWKEICIAYVFIYRILNKLKRMTVTYFVSSGFQSNQLLKVTVVVLSLSSDECIETEMILKFCTMVY